MMQNPSVTTLLVTLFATVATSAMAHDPVFGLGPHVLFKDGIEIAPEIHSGKAGERTESELALELTYGLSGDWAAGVVLPYQRESDNSGSVSGRGDISLFTKYRLWRDDAPGVQQSLSIAFKLKTDSGADSTGTASSDSILGLAWGYESRRWYRWAALRYRINGENDNGLTRGKVLLLDMVGGYRARLTGYREPDTVWLLELNGELAQRAELNNITLPDTGGEQWFVSPGIFWTLRNFAVKAGVQIPLINRLNGNQPTADYRARLILEWHL